MFYAVLQEATRALLDAGAEPNVANSIGNTALHRAARHGHFDVAFLLLSTSSIQSHRPDNGLRWIYPGVAFVAYGEFMVQCAASATNRRHAPFFWLARPRSFPYA